MNYLKPQALLIGLEHFTSNTTFAIDFVGYSEEIRNSQFGGLTIKDAIVDQFREQGLSAQMLIKNHLKLAFKLGY